MYQGNTYNENYEGANCKEVRGKTAGKFSAFFFFLTHVLHCGKHYEGAIYSIICNYFTTIVPVLNFPMENTDCLPLGQPAVKVA